jgi:hypothetical protein
MGEWMYHIFLTSALPEGEWSASCTSRFTPGERAHWIGGRWTPEPIWTTWRRENSWPDRDSNSDPSVVQPAASRYTDYTIPAPWLWFIDYLKCDAMYSANAYQCFIPEDGDSIFPQNIGKHPPDCMVSHPTCSRWFLARGFFYPEDGGDTFLRNIGTIHKIYTAPHPIGGILVKILLFLILLLTSHNRLIKTHYSNKRFFCSMNL